MQRKIVQAGIRDGSYVEGSRELRESAELEVDPKTIERVVNRIGRERAAERSAAVESWQALPLPEQQKGCPLPLAPQVAVVEFDCGRMLIRERSRKQPSKAAEAETETAETETAETPAEDAARLAEQALEAAVASSAGAACESTGLSEEVDSANSSSAATAATEATFSPTETVDEASTEAALHGFGQAQDECRSRYWRDHKVGVLLTMTSEEQLEDPCPQVPETFRDPRRVAKLVRELGGHGGGGVPPPSNQQPRKKSDRPGRPKPRVRTLVASRLCSAAFGAVLVAAAWARGFAAAKRKAFVADGASMNWTMHARYFSHYVPILDFIHALQYVFAAAVAGRTFDEGWPIYARWIQQVWSGQVAEVIAALQQRQAELGRPPKDASATDPRKIVATALGYLTTHQDRMDYARYRRLGLPLMSSHVESAVKQINRRVKGTEKFWSEAGAEAVLQLRADYLSDTAPLELFWLQRQQHATGQRCYSCAA